MAISWAKNLKSELADLSVNQGRVHDARALELRPEIFRMGYFWGVLSDYDTVISLRRFIYTVRPTYSDIRTLG